MAEEPPRVSTLEELVQRLNLIDIRYDEVSCKRAERTSDTADEPQGMRLEVATANNPSEHQTRLVLTFDDANAAYRVVAVGTFRCTESIRAEDELYHQFAREVGVYSVYPYVREALMASASRLRVDAPLLGLLKRPLRLHPPQSDQSEHTS